MSDRPSRTPDLLLERLALDELPPAQRAELRAALQADSDAAQRLQALADSSATILRENPPAVVAAELKRRLAAVRTPRRRRLWLGLSAPALAGAAALLLVWQLRAPATAEQPGAATEVTRLKGLPPQLLLHRARGAEVEPLGDGARVGEGDRLQISYVAAGRSHGTIFSIDGRGAVTVHLPAQGELAAALQEGGEVALNFSYQLDDAPGFERFFLVTGTVPFALAPVLQAARELVASGSAATGRLPLPAGLEQRSVQLQREVP